MMLMCGIKTNKQKHTQNKTNKQKHAQNKTNKQNHKPTTTKEFRTKKKGNHQYTIHAEKEKLELFLKQILKMKVRRHFFKPLPNMTFLKEDRSRQLKL